MRAVYDRLLEDGLYSSVIWVSENAKKAKVNPNGRADLGYDIQAVDPDGNLVYIEVKSSSAPINEKIEFYLSSREYAFAMNHLDSYVVFYVSDVKRGHTPLIHPLENLFKDGNLNSSVYSIECEKNFKISSVIDSEK